MKKTELIPFLEKLKGKGVTLKNSGYMACQASIEEFDFYIKYNILTMKDNKSENYMVLNLEKIKQIHEEKQKMLVTIYVDDEIETEVSIQCK